MSLPSAGDLSLPREVADAVLVDECRITRDAEGIHDDEFDYATGTRTRPTGDRATVYEGPCLFVTGGGSGSRREEGGTERASFGMGVRVPASTPAREGDRLEVTAIHDGGNPRLMTDPLGLPVRYRVAGVPERSFQVQKRLAVEVEPQME